MRYQCFHPTVKTSNATPESAIWRKFLWLAIPSEKFSSEYLPHASLGLAFLFSFGDNLLQLFRFVSSAQGKNGKQNCCGEGEKFAANERSSCEHLDHWRESVHRNYLVGKYSGNCWQWNNKLVYIHAFNFSFMGTIINPWNLLSDCVCRLRRPARKLPLVFP